MALGKPNSRISLSISINLSATTHCRRKTLLSLRVNCNLSVYFLSETTSILSIIPQNTCRTLLAFEGRLAPRANISGIISICLSVTTKCYRAVHCSQYLARPYTISCSEKKTDSMKCRACWGRCSDLVLMILMLEQRMSTSACDTVKTLLSLPSYSYMPYSPTTTVPYCLSPRNSFLSHMDYNTCMMEWPKQLTTPALIIVDTLILTGSLKAVIRKDGWFKPFMLVLPIGLLSVLALNHYYLNPQRKDTTEIEDSIFFFLATTQLYIVALTGIVLLISVAQRLIGDNDREAVRSGKNQLIILFSFIFGALIAGYYLLSFDGEVILRQKHLWLCAAITIVSLLLLAVAGKVVSRWTNSQAVRRKIFHIGPILCLPVIHYLNQQLLPLILVAAFSALLLLEVIRYHQQLIQQENEHKQNGYSWLVRPLQIMNPFFDWMRQFNQRQSHFWFTHLFLGLSLLTAYLLPLVSHIKIKLPGHLVLILVAADGLAAFIGVRYGKIRIFRGKSLQGTTAFILTCFIGCWLLLPLNNTQLAILSVAAGAAELFGGDADNILTLLVFYAIRLSFILIVWWRVHLSR